MEDFVAQNITNYTFSASGGTFTALVAGTTNSGQGSTDDGAWNNNSIGFDFWYMGTRYTSISASTNGWLAFGTSISSYGYANSLASTATSNATTLRPIIAPLWDDLAIAASSSFTYQTSGTAGSRIFTAEYLNEDWKYAATSACISFQVKLYEGTGKVEFIYRPESGTLSSPSASIGITGNASGSYLSLDGTGTSPAASSVSETSTLSTKPASGQTYQFTPPVPANPGGLNFTAVTSSSMTLNWNDNSSNEIGFVIYRSDDNGLTYNYINQTVANVTSSIQSGLSASSTYYWKVYAVTEGALSAISTNGSQTTLACTGSGTTRTWVGAGSGGAGTDFNASANWNPAGVPACNDSLILALTGAATMALSSSIEIGAIKASVSGANNVFRLNTGAFTLKINQTATYNIPSGNGNTQLQINVQNGGTIIYTKNATFSAAAGNTFPIDGIGGSTGTIIFKGDVTFGSGCATGSGDQPNTVILDGVGTQTITCNNVSYYVFLGKSSTEIGNQNSPTVIFTGTSYATPLANLNINGTSTLDISTNTLNRYTAGGTINMAAGSTLKLAGSSGGQTGSNFPGNFTAFTFNENSTVEYNSANGVNQTIFSTPAYGNLTLTNKTGSGSSTKTAGGNLNIAGNLTVSDAFTTFSGGTSRSHNIAGDWTNNGAFTYTTSSTVTFNGSVNQQIAGTSSTTFYNLTANNTGTTGNNTITLIKSARVNATLTLTDGYFATSSPSGILTLASTANTTIGNANSFVNGPLSYEMANSGISVLNLPLGKGADWRPVILTPTHSAVTSYTYSAELFNASAAALQWTLPGTISHVSKMHYVDINRTITGGAAAPNTDLTGATLQMYYSTTDGSDDAVTDYANLTIAKAPTTGSAWTDIAGTATANGTGSITSGSFTSFSRFALANKTGGANPLPIELLTFNANCNDNKIELNWTTASETNNDYFTIEKSINSIDFESIGIVMGAGNSPVIKSYSFTDTNPSPATVYYRLKQTDFNDDHAVFNIVSVNGCGDRETEITNAYNDSGILTLNIYADTDQDAEINMYDIAGRKVLSSHYYLSNGNNEKKMDCSEISFGTYLITLKNKRKLICRKIIIKFI